MDAPFRQRAPRGFGPWWQVLSGGQLRRATAGMGRQDKRGRRMAEAGWKKCRGGDPAPGRRGEECVDRGLRETGAGIEVVCGRRGSGRRGGVVVVRGRMVGGGRWAGWWARRVSERRRERVSGAARFWPSVRLGWQARRAGQAGQAGGQTWSSESGGTTRTRPEKESARAPRGAGGRAGAGRQGT